MLDNLKWGIRWGLYYAGFFSIVAVISALVQYQTELLMPALAFYWVGGILGGTIVGLLRPFAKSVIGSVLIGTIAAFPLNLGMVIFLLPRTLVPEKHILTFAIVTTLFLGPIYTIGILAGREASQRRRKKAASEAVNHASTRLLP